MGMDTKENDDTDDHAKNVVGDMLFSKTLESQDDIVSLTTILQEKLECFKQLQVVLFRICKGKCQ